MKAQNWDKAAKCLEESLKLMQEAGSEMTLGRTVVALVLVNLVREDSIEASKVFQAWGGYCDPDQTTACHQMINGFNEDDAEKAKMGLTHNCMGSLDVEYQRIIKLIKLPEGDLEAAAKSYGASKATSAPAPSSSSNTSHSHGVDPSPAADYGMTKSQREEDSRSKVVEEERDRELAAGGGDDDDDDDDEGLC